MTVSLPDWDIWTGWLGLCTTLGTGLEGELDPDWGPDWDQIASRQRQDWVFFFFFFFLVQPQDEEASGNFPSFCLRKKLSGFNSQNPSIALLCCFFFVVVVLSFFFSLCCFQRDSKCPGVVLTLLPYRTCPPGGQADSRGGRGERGRGSSVSFKVLVETLVDWCKFLQENTATFHRRKTDIFVLMLFFIIIFQK